MTKTGNKAVRSEAGKLALGLVFVALVIIPLLKMFSFIEGQGFIRLVRSPVFGRAALHSLSASLFATVISVTLAFLLAWCLRRTRMKGTGVFSVLFILPMLIPSVSIGMGLTILFGSNGIFTNLLHLKQTIYGFRGIVIGSVIYSFPVAFLMLNDAMKYEDASPYEAASVLGISKWRQLLSIELPYLKRALISASFSVFTMTITDYGVPLMVGGKCSTLSVMMYQEVIGQLDFGKGSAIGLFLLIPALIAFVADLLNRERAKASFVTRPFELRKNSFRDGFAYIVCGLVAAAAAVLIGSFCVLAFSGKYPKDMSFTFEHVLETFDLSGGEYLLNSLLIALGTSIIGIVAAFTTAYLTARMPSKTTKFLHLMSVVSLAVPGVVLGLSYALTFNGSFIYGTIIILIMVNLMHFFASPYLMMYNSLGKLNSNLESVGQTLGISRWRIVKDVIIPQSKGTILEMFAYFFVNCMMTISAVSFLATISTKPLALLINQLEAQAKLECVAVVSLLILAVNMLVKGIIYILQRKKLSLPVRGEKEKSIADTKTI